VRAVVYDEFGGRAAVRDVPDPLPASHGAVIRVEATGLCRSDWHGWVGHDPGIALPHVPGHEFAGVVAAVGTDVTGWRPGDRVTVPFVCACGTCPQCAAGDHQVCDRQFQPGFSGWGSFAELVAIDQADVNLVRLPDSVDAVTAASLGCRFATAYRAVLSQGQVRAAHWVAVHGCGGVGLSAVMVAASVGARVVAVDVNPAALELASRFGAVVTVDATEVPDVASAVRDATEGGAHVSLDALGSMQTCVASIRGLRKRGRHVQVGLLPNTVAEPAVPMGRIIARELEIVGSHGMAAHSYAEMLDQVVAGRLRPDLLVGRRIGLAGAGEALAAMSDAPVGTPAGMTVIVP
jgi:D-arabinose 1-dehydrogenase-like Zn-dependent alcohol dehydrogenase